MQSRNCPPLYNLAIGGSLWRAPPAVDFKALERAAPKKPRKVIPIRLIESDAGWSDWWRRFCKNAPKYQERLVTRIGPEPLDLLHALVVRHIEGRVTASRAAGLLGIHKGDFLELVELLRLELAMASLVGAVLQTAFHNQFPSCNPKNCYRPPRGALRCTDWGRGAGRMYAQTELLEAPNPEPGDG